MAGAEAEEAELVQRLLNLQTGDDGAPPTERRDDAPAWYRDAYAFLEAHGGEHWWCHHGDVMSGGWVLAPQRASTDRPLGGRARAAGSPTECNMFAALVLASVLAGLAELFCYHDEQPLVQDIWRAVAAQLVRAVNCAGLQLRPGSHACQPAVESAPALMLLLPAACLDRRRCALTASTRTTRPRPLTKDSLLQRPPPRCWRRCAASTALAWRARCGPCIRWAPARSCRQRSLPRCLRR